MRKISKSNQGKNRVAMRKAAHHKTYLESWAEREIKIACDRERESAIKNGHPEDALYGCACYDSALKALKSLAKDGHSGYSIKLTQNIVNRLIDGKPLTPIEDVDEVWDNVSDFSDTEGYKSYQCKRCSALFKDIYDDGHVEYSYNDLCYCKDINTGSTYTSSLVNRIIREMYPITMPFMPPNKQIVVLCEDFLTDKKNGDFDTVGIYHAVLPDGEKAYINRWFKEGENDWEEIDDAEYQERKAGRIRNE